MKRLENFEQVTPKAVYGLLLQKLPEHDHFQREDVICCMPSDWCSYENYDLANSRWSGALRKAKNAGLIERGLGFWRVTRMGLIVAKAIKDGGLE